MTWTRSTTELTLNGAERLLWCALECAADLKASVAISIVDRAGYILCSARMDGTPGVSAAISADKARTAAQLKTMTQPLQRMVDRSRASYVSIAGLSFVSGGAPLEVEGEVVGAIGVSGDTETVDHEIAKRAVENFREQLAGEQAETGSPVMAAEQARNGEAVDDQ